MAKTYSFPLYEITIDDNEIFGVDKLSVVSDAAVEVDFQYFSKAEPQKMEFSVVDEYEHKIVGCLLRADYPIYRVGNSGYEYFVQFSRETIEKIAEKMLKDNTHNRFNIEHDVDTRGLDLIQFFIKDTAKGIAPKGFDEVADGSLFGVYHITDDALWESIKNGELRGLSVEIVSSVIPVGEIEFEMGKQNSVEDEVLSLLDDIENKIKELK